MKNAWQGCLAQLEAELSPQLFNTWIRPLQAHLAGGTLRLLAPNQFVLEQVGGQFQDRIRELVAQWGLKLALEIGSSAGDAGADAPPPVNGVPAPPAAKPRRRATPAVDPAQRFDTFIEGKSNRLARASSLLVSENGSGLYNPLLLYGGVGLGKTHLLHAVGNALLAQRPDARVVYVSGERFVTDMVTALQQNRFDAFRAQYRNLDLLLVDDVQFLAGKERSQEEFFHVFNAMLESKSQLVMSSDRFPRDIKGLEDRLKSRFGWGLSVAVEPPDMETRVAILLSKAELAHQTVPQDVAFFIAKRVHSNVRELEGALRTVIAYATLTHAPITLELAREALKDIVKAQDRQVTLDAILKAVAEYYRLRGADLTSRSRKRSLVRPRQVGMALAKELTSCSLPEIGAAFGGRDHTTVLYACERVVELRRNEESIAADYGNLRRILMG
ncbi:MAG: chromosomal replication initiator protein DnaA [Immundisolibacter sp.]|uniref:chromosomal replication initiator protein DnaA n=1 Tax=Immundisolibacter sp. TaxID=1934948 RepID=UPI003D1203A4